jgi:hypothetical protein
MVKGFAPFSSNVTEPPDNPETLPPTEYETLDVTLEPPPATVGTVTSSTRQL